LKCDCPVHTGKTLDITAEFHYLERLRLIARCGDNSEYRPTYSTGGDERISK
jgi:hypothetical protein